RTVPPRPPPPSSSAVPGQTHTSRVEVNAALEVERGPATSWSVSDDGLVYVSQLRAGVRFHNGRTMTADDVVYSFQRIADPETASPQASRFAHVRTAVATGEYEVTFTV